MIGIGILILAAALSGQTVAPPTPVMDYQLTQPEDCFTGPPAAPGLIFYLGSDGMVGISSLSCDAAFVVWTREHASGATKWRA